MRILVLSPHRDDAVFSLLLSISHWATVGHQVTVLNVFTRSLYAPYANTGSMSREECLDYVSELRKLEDHRALKAIGVASIVDLNLMDAPIRLACDSSVVCEIEALPDDAVHPMIREALSSLACDSCAKDNAALVLPLGLGHHVDHLTARNAGLPLTINVPCAFYEDLPYAARIEIRADLPVFRKDLAARLYEPLCPVLCHGTQAHSSDFKRSIALIYESQIDRMQANTIATFSHRYHGAERLWANGAWLSMAIKERLSTPQRTLRKEPLSA